TGVIVANWVQSFQLNFHFTEDGIMILAGLMRDIGAIMVKEMAVGIHPFALNGWQLEIGSVLMLLIVVPLLKPDANSFTSIGRSLLVYAAILSAVAFALWYSILKYNKAGEVSIYKFVTPVSGTILYAMFIPEEHLTVFIIGALVLV